MVKRVTDIRCSMAVRPYTDGSGEREVKYLITRVTNSVDFCPKEILAKADVKRLIEEGWTISVLSND
jgi:hypothetical protein